MVFTERVALEVEPGQRVIAVTSEPELTVAPEEEYQASSTPAWEDLELLEWVKGSSSTARDFCRTMVTASVGAIPIYFAVLKYLGLEKVSDGWWVVSVAPPFLLLAAMLVFVLALRPVLSRVRDRQDFVAFREQRFRATNASIIVGMALLIAAVIVSNVVFLALLQR